MVGIDRQQTKKEARWTVKVWVHFYAHAYIEQGHEDERLTVARAVAGFGIHLHKTKETAAAAVEELGGVYLEIEAAQLRPFVGDRKDFDGVQLAGTDFHRRLGEYEGNHAEEIQSPAFVAGPDLPWKVFQYEEHPECYSHGIASEEDRAWANAIVEEMGTEWGPS
jgi:hypothetical protein